jgi:hypothetical protein
MAREHTTPAAAGYALLLRRAFVAADVSPRDGARA